MDVSRHQRRIYLVQAIYLWEHQQGRDKKLDEKAAEALLKYTWEDFSSAPYDETISEFDRDRFFGMIDNIKKIRKFLILFAPDWPLDKIATADRAVLYLGLFELLHTDVPPAVVINEAVELAKEFGGERSSKFVNGVLSTANKDQEKKTAKKEKKKTKKEAS
ncbi:MAG: transcription antitermination factor NusB [Candidatus Gracilibacteria bacterium]|nr:transcription antitermination factor NusB [Candidatus Gracilibacteria bacterium]